MDVSEAVVRLVALFGGIAALGLLALLLRWTYGTQHATRIPSDDPSDPMGHGLLTEVSRVPTSAAAEVLRARLGAAGIRATVSRDGAGDGPTFRLLVFPDDLPAARVVLSRGALE